MAELEGFLRPLPIPADRWEEVSLDFVTGLPRTLNGHDAVLVVVDRFTKWAYLIPTQTTVDAKGTAELFHTVVFSRHGMPKRIISDRDSRFTSHFWRAFFEEMGTTLAMSTAYHPQTDGQTERVNRVIEEALRSFVQNSQVDWDRCLPNLQFAYNTSKHSSTGETPFYLNYGKHPVVPAELMRDASSSADQQVPATSTYVADLKASIAQAVLQLEKSRERQRNVADRRRQDQQYAIGDRVLLSTAHMALPPNLTRKLARLYEGPFVIEATVGENAYKLKLPDSVKLHPVFNVSQLRPYNDPAGKFPGRTSDPSPPVVIDGETEYEVEAILLHKDVRGSTGRLRRQYLVQWKGYSSLDNTWEPVENLRNAQEAVDRYLQRSGIRQRSGKRSNSSAVEFDRQQLILERIKDEDTWSVLNPPRVASGFDDRSDVMGRRILFCAACAAGFEIGLDDRSAVVGRQIFWCSMRRWI